jgi:beta-N-acetylhexosaminidase
MWMKNIDAEYPASLSSVFINDLLRNELGFTGIVMTDDLRMKSMSQKYTSAAVAVRAIGAGCDIIQTPENFVEAANAVIQAVKKGEISEDRINDSVLKILNKKSEIGILK